MAYSWGMSEQWLEIEDGQRTHRVPLSGSLTRIGGASADVSMAGLPTGELHVWSEPPKVVLVAGDVRLAVNGVESREGLLTDGDEIEWGDMRFRFRQKSSGAVLQEIQVESPPAMAPEAAPSGFAPDVTPSGGGAEAASSGFVPDVTSFGGGAEAAPSGGGTAWTRVRAGMIVDLGMANKATVKRWQETVMRGDFAPDACARDVASGVDVDGDDGRLVERSARLLRDFLMSSTMSGSEAAKRKVRMAGKKGAAVLISQLLVIGVYTLIILAAMLLLRAKDVGFDAFFDGILGRDTPTVDEG